jgi:hypothetical protein
MKPRFQLIFFFISLLLTAGKCGYDDGWAPGGPTVQNLHGSWELVKIETPTGQRPASQLSYKELLNISGENGYTVDKTQYWFGNPTAKNADMSFLVNYRYDNLKRFYKVKMEPGHPFELQATEYLVEIGGAADSVKYYYQEVWR